MLTTSRFVVLLCIVLFTGRVMAAEPANLALGKKVQLSQSGYGRGASNGHVLTDNELSTRTETFRRDPRVANYSYPGMIQVAVDLESPADIGEASIRFSGGSKDQGTCLPGWVRLVASDDGLNYYTVATYSRFNPGDQAKYGVPDESGKAFFFNLRFKDVNVRARHIGFEVYGTAYFGMDEVHALAGEPGAKYKAAASFPASDFTMSGPRMYFHKPLVMLPSNMNAPTPIGIIFPDGFKEKFTATVDLPKGVSFAGGRLGGNKLTGVAGTPVEGGYTRYTFQCTPPPRMAKDWGRVFLRDDAPQGKESAIRYQLSWGDRKSPVMEQPIRAIKMGSAPQPKRIMAGLCYMSILGTLEWPGALEDYKALGFNTLSLFSYSTKFDDPAQAETIAKFRDAGFKVINVDNSYETISRWAGAQAGEAHCQFADGTTGRRFCLSYRGELYKKELERIANEYAKARPDVFSPDIELWDSNGPTESKKCTRCQADFKASGAKSWGEWQVKKGAEMWIDLATAVKNKAKELGVKPPDLGCYDFRPGTDYHLVFRFDQLYPKYMDNAQVSTYSSFYPYNVAYIGDEARKDRQQLPKSDVMPWITPGDAGTFPGEMFTWALMECYANGSRGVHFWSHRMWDAELLDAHARALRMVVPVEDVVVDGKLVEGVACEPAMRVSGMENKGEMFLLITKDYKPYKGSVKVSLPAPVTGEVVDLGSGKTLARLDGKKEFTLKFNKELARAVYIKPAK
ncbi:MAG: hypothetical protein ABFD69_02265 [Candidatus Sumerlaeia bacterium]